MADASRVEQGPVAGAQIERQDRAALEEERALLLVEGLVRGQVHHRRVGLDLAEVGVDRGVEREVAGQAELGVEARRAGGRAAADRVLAGGAAQHVRQQLEVPRARQLANAVQLAELVHAPRVLARDQLPLVLFLVAVDPAPGVHPPHLLLLWAVAQLVERDAELRRPALVVVGHLAVPDRVPRRVPLGLAVAEDEVDLAAAGRQVELEAGALVVVAVDADAHDVAGEVVAPAGVAVDLVGLVEDPDRVVEVLVVVQDLELGGLRGLRTLGRNLLREATAPLPLLPRLVVEPAVDHRRLARDPLGVVHARRVLAAGAAGLRAAGGRRGPARARARARPVVLASSTSRTSARRARPRPGRSIVMAGPREDSGASRGHPVAELDQEDVVGSCCPQAVPVGAE